MLQEISTIYYLKNCIIYYRDGWPTEKWWSEITEMGREERKEREAHMTHEI
jgi:hypothetical protein